MSVHLSVLLDSVHNVTVLRSRSLACGPFCPSPSQRDAEAMLARKYRDVSPFSLHVSEALPHPTADLDWPTEEMEHRPTKEQRRATRALGATSAASSGNVIMMNKCMQHDDLGRLGPPYYVVHHRSREPVLLSDWSAARVVAASRPRRPHILPVGPLVHQ